MLHYRKILFISVIILLFYYPRHVFASGNCCFGHEGEYGCDTQTGQLYCRDGTVSNYCSCQNSESPTATPVPTAVPTQAEQEVSCPTNASFDEDTQQCVCGSGYVANNATCISYTDYCWNQYGGNSTYDTNSGSCTCSSGYIWNSSETSCISLATYCQNGLGSNSYYNNSNNSCSCDEGFAIENNQCVFESAQEPTVAATTSQPIVTTVPILPTVAVAIASPSAKTSKKDSSTKNTNTKKNTNKNPLKLHLKLSDFKTIPTSRSNNIQHFFQSIWEFIQNIFGGKKSTGSTSDSQINTSKYQLPLQYQQ